jgi:ADP-ribosylglycohydrolase
MISDDTEHACMTAQAILASHGNVETFARSLAWRLRGWLIALPAGVGWATLRSVVKLWMGFPPARSGVFSAGNGPAMRAPLIGAYFASEPARRRAFVDASTLLTHRDARAVRGAQLIAYAAAIAISSPDGTIDVDRFIAESMDLAGDDRELLQLLAQLAEHDARRSTPKEFADAIGCGRDGGVSGYIYRTVPVCLFCWLRTPTDFRAAVGEVIALGGDTDSTAAIVGALVGATAGAASIPRDWLDGVWEFPRSKKWMRRMADELNRSLEPTAAQIRPVPFACPALLPRNVFFLIIVLAHGIRRLLPPY